MGLNLLRHLFGGKYIEYLLILVSIKHQDDKKTVSLAGVR